MIVPVDIRSEATARELLAVQKTSYAVEADLIGFREIPPLLETLDSLRSCGEDFFAYLLDGAIAGAVSTREEDGVIDIHRMIVSPDHFRKGIAGELLAYLEGNSGEATALIVATAEKNVPAVSLYLKHGFTIVERLDVPPGLRIVRFRKELAVG